MPRETNIQIRRGAANDWTSVNPTLASGEMAIENDTRRLKVGDGTTAWNELGYLSFDGGDLDSDSVSVATEVGTDVAIEAFAQVGSEVGVGLSFSNISDSGTTTVTKTTSGSPTLPGDFSLNNSLGSYNITTTATFTGSILVKFVLPSSVTQQVFDTVRIFKLTSGVTTDVTVLEGPYAPDYATRTVWASVESFSEFYVIPSVIAPTATPTPEPTATPTPEPTVAAEFDALFTDVLLLMHGNGADGDTTFVDSSTYNRTITRDGSAQISTSQSKFGGSSLSFPSAGSSSITERLEVTTAPSDFNFGTGDFTIEAWIYIEGFANEETIFAKTNNYTGYRFAVVGATRRLLFEGGQTTVFSPNDSVSANQWHHVAACCKAGIVRIFIDGTLVGSNSISQSVDSNIAVTIGNYAVFGTYGNEYEATMDGFIDELRVTAAARYEESFSPPVAAFPETPPPVGEVFITSQPPSSAVFYFGEGSLSVTAYAYGGESISYQWQQSSDNGSTWTNMSGKTSSNMVVTGLTSTANGYRYRVVVSSSTNSKTSNSTTITIDEVGDPLFGDVVSLLPFNGPNGSTVYTDFALNPITPTFFPGGGTHAISSENPKFGSGALKVTGNAWPTLNFPTPILWTEAVTVELWFRTTSDCTPLRGGGDVQVSGGVVRATSAATGSILFTDTKQVADGEWHHLAVSRASGEAENDRYYLDGQLIGEQTPYWRTNDNWASVYFARPGSASIFVDDFRLTKAERYAGQSFTLPIASFFAPVAVSLPASSTAYGGAITLSPTSNVGSDSATYQWQKQEGSVGGFVNIAGATSATLTLENLTDADDTGDAYRVVVSVVGRSTDTSNATVLAVDESGINADNRFRVTAAASTTALTAAVESTTGYWKMISSTGQESAVIGSQWSQYSPYYWNTGAISGLPSGSEKTVEIFSCDASGNPSGELEYVSFAPSSQAITAADASGCTSLRGFNLSSSATPYGSWYGVSTLPAALVSVRAVGVIGSGGMYSQWGPYPANVTEGINIAGQTLSAAALNQLYEDLGNGTNSARIFVPGNPGTADDNESIATGKGYTIFGS